MRLLEKVTNTPWLITPEALEVIVGVVTRDRLDEDLAAELRAARAERPAAVAMRGGVPLAGTEGVTVRDGVAHVGVIGPITRYSDIFSRVSGLASVEQVASDFQAALDAPDVRAILLELDTPGGEVTGIAALGEAIYSARGRKPVWAYVDGMAASAGYWLASGAQRIVTDPAGLLGSIGAVLAVRDPSKGPAAGRAIEFVSSQSPHKRANPTTDEGRAQYQRIVDQTAEAFIEAVARNRGVTAADVIDRYGAGGVLVGRHAVEAGLADQVGTFETTLAALAGQTRKERNPMDWKQMWAGFFGAAQEAGALRASDGTPATVAASLVAAEPPAPPEPPAAPDNVVASAAAEEAERVRAAEERAQAAEERAREAAQRLAEAEAQQRAAAVEAFVERAIREGRALPVERDALTQVYAFALDKGAAAHVEALIAARPAHTLTVEQVPAAAAVPVARAMPAGEGGAMTPERRRELLSSTPEGRAVLAREAQASK